MKSKLMSRILVVLISISVVAGVYVRVNAQEEVVNYLYGRFKQKNIPVTEITVLEKSPLNLQVVIQSANPWVTAEDIKIMSMVDREIFVFARQQGYYVDAYTLILEDSQGKQLDSTTKQPDIESNSHLNFSPATLTDEVVQNMALERMNSYLDKFKLDNVNLTINISSDEGLQTLTLDVRTDSLGKANDIALFLWALPDTSFIDDLNAQGARIVFYRAKIIGENDDTLFDYVLDTEMSSGGWTIDDRLQNPSGDGPPPAPEP
ncbi:MAG: hypothetical protein HZB18_08045 [Chloroflexi bacterium]|nr:hypothetical protein [Chloroflexota bacterium]